MSGTSSWSGRSRPFKVDVAIFEGRYQDMPLHAKERTTRADAAAP